VASAIGKLASSSPKVFVRINSLLTPYATTDIKAIINRGLRGILVPKSEKANQIRRIDAMIAETEKTAGTEIGAIGIIALVESPRGVMNTYEIASASPRVLGVAFGAEDYAVDLGVNRTKEGMEISYPRMSIPVACHAAGVQAIDCVHTNIRDREGLIAETQTGRQYGFQGKQVIHPDQIVPVNEVFTPSADEIAYALRVVEAFETAVKQGSASTALDGKMIDTPVAERARRLIAFHRAITGNKNRTHGTHGNLSAGE
jgi:citrate lyase subunit beta/citryl-CoA lyase